MISCIIQYENKEYSIDLSRGIDLSIPLREGLDTVNAFYAPLVQVSPVKSGGFIGDTNLGGPLNFKNILINPHGNGTHTECVGHISTPPQKLEECVRNLQMPAELVSIYPQKTENGDRVIHWEQLAMLLNEKLAPAIIIRSLPNDEDKHFRSYSGNNPPYFEPKVMIELHNRGVRHLLCDLPSVDREEDKGALAAHKAFWNYPAATLSEKTITELIFVPNELKDGLYWLQIQTIAMELDVSPSRPVVYKLLK